MTLIRSLFACTSMSLAIAGLASGAVAADASKQELIKRGEYMAKAGDCIACHTSDSSQPLAGGSYINTPFGSIAAPNITPDKATGIGAWTEAQFYRTMHDGIGHKGQYLYPVMPFPWYTTVRRDDVSAIWAYLQTVPAVHKVSPPNKFHFPFNVREALLAWRTVFFKAKTFEPDPTQTAEVNRGSYLVNGLAHCGECHNSEPVAGTSKWRKGMQGGVIDSWYAPNITQDMRDGIGKWDKTEIASFLKTGVSPDKGIAVGPMAEAVHSLHDMTDADLLAMAAYLKTVPAKSDGDDAKHQLFAGRDARGGQTYLDFCASCHGTDGRGLNGVIPALNGNGSVMAKGPQNVINVVLGGLAARGRYAPMIAVGAGMSDQEIADVANYVRQTWDNAAPPTAEAGMVAAARAKTDTLMSPSAAAACPKIDAPALAKALTSGTLKDQIASLTDANMANDADAIVTGARRAAPGIAQADLVNGLTSAYCGVAGADAKINGAEKAARIGEFSQLVYMSVTGHRPEAGAPARTARR